MLKKGEYARVITVQGSCFWVGEIVELIAKDWEWWFVGGSARTGWIKADSLTPLDEEINIKELL